MIIVRGRAEIHNLPQGRMKNTQSCCFLPSPSGSSRTAVLKLGGKFGINCDLNPTGFFSFSVYLDQNMIISEIIPKTE